MLTNSTATLVQKNLKKRGYCLAVPAARKGVVPGYVVCLAGGALNADGSANHHAIIFGSPAYPLTLEQVAAHLGIYVAAEPSLFTHDDCLKAVEHCLELTDAEKRAAKKYADKERAAEEAVRQFFAGVLLKPADSVIEDVLAAKPASVIETL